MPAKEAPLPTVQETPTLAESPQARSPEADRAPDPAADPATVTMSGETRSLTGPISLGSMAPLSTGSGSRSLSGAPSSASIASTLTTAHDTLFVQEASRTLAFIRFILVLSIVVGASLLLLPGDPIARYIFMGGCAVMAVTCARISIKLRDETKYSIERITVVAYVAVATVTAALYYFGVFSAALAPLVWGIYFFSAGQSFRATFAIYLSSAIAYFVLAMLIIFHVVPDHGLISAHDLGTFMQLVIVVLAEVMLFLTFANARATRRSTLAAIERHDLVVRNLAQREALLQEAKQELERALDFAGLGRFSDTTVGSFRLGKVLGRGAMGEVYEGTHVETQGLAAVKLLQTHKVADADVLKRFLREAKIAQSIDSRHVVKVLEFGGLASGVPYLAMERLHGEDLADILRRTKQLGMRKVVALLRQVGEGLRVAQACGVVHRDLKPRNLFFAEIGGAHEWKILDFGVSKLSDGEATQTHDRIVGTPAYMAPEQAAGRPVSHRTDLYALGIIAYRALTGRPAFSGEHIAEILYQVTHNMPPRPSSIARLNPEVDLVLSIAMAKADKDRFDSGAELASALEAAAAGKLDAELVARGERLAAKHPWGSEK